MFGNRRPSTPASLPWSRETTRHKINMMENVMFNVIVKVEHDEKDTLPRLSCYEMLLQCLFFRLN